tara:strand:- start:37 stop:570 length:534 start_codon:yes stop_codon:yes gene_type:complete
MTNIINALTTLRIFLAPVIFFFLINGDYLLCMILFFLAGATDFLDGYLARKYNAESQMGEILDPIADKIIVIFLLIGLSVTIDSNIIAFLSSIIISREIGVAALRDFSARNQLSDKTKVTFLAKTKTALQLSTIGSYLFALTFNLNLLIVVTDIFLMIASLVTIFTGYQYAINILKK